MTFRPDVWARRLPRLLAKGRNSCGACVWAELVDRVSVLWPTLAGDCFGSASIGSSNRWLVSPLCGNCEWGRRPDTRSTSFNVKEFGAQGDGRADDTKALQAAFDAAAKAYTAAAKRAGVNPEFRVYQVMQGAPGDTYWIFTSQTSMAGFDALMASDPKIFAAFTAEDRKLFDDVVGHVVST